LIECGVRPACPVGLLFVSAEETGSAYGLNHVLREHPELFDKQDIILVPDGGNEDGSLIEVSEKSLLWLKFRIKGKQSHGSMPHRGCNAFRAAARLACALDAGLPERFSAQDDLYEPPHSTFEPTMHEKNVPNVNTIPGEDVFCFDCRVLPHFDLDEVLRYVRSQMGRVDAELGTESDLEILNRVDAAPPTPADAPAVGVIQRAVAEVYGVQGRPMGVGGGTVAAEFRRAGYPVVVWSRTESTAHQANESCLIPNMVGDAKVYAHVFCQKLP
ncbi:MAG: M20 family metallo-hydrolase, partial [Candidatus Brocadiia bacterium]|nr:M20 family metallo-hydrolase [Candidatus Brocadiia bacterium]